MANFCLPFKETKEFLNRLKDGTLSPEKLAEMTSEERRAEFGKFLDEGTAKNVNAEFESKLLLKNQQAGIISWAKKFGGLKPEAMRELVDRVNKMTEVLNPESKDAFLKDLASKKLGVGVSYEEAKKISELAGEVADKKAAMADGGDRMDYGRAKVAFHDYINGIKTDATKLSLTDRLKPSNQLQNLKDASGFSKSLNASLDNSAIFRQGWKTLWTNPTLWLKNAGHTFLDIKDVGLKGQDVLKEVQADINSRPNADLYKKAKLAVGNLEEAYPSHVAEKVPVLGRLYKASEAAYTGFVQRMRADVFDKYVDIAQKNGVDITDSRQVEQIGKLVNSLTGRGDLSRLGITGKAADTVNNVFFSPRFLKSQLDVLTAHSFSKDVTPFVRKQAAINLVKIIGGTAAVLATANAVAPGSVEKDPRSSDFGKIKIGDTRFDVSGGMGSILTLAARELTQSSKSSSTKLITKLNSGQFGSQTGMDVLYNFAEGKLSPAAGVVRDFLKGQDFQGNKPTIAGEAANLFVPLPIRNSMELAKDKNSAGTLVGTLADALGIGVNTYSPNSNWDSSASKELDQFKQKVGADKFQQANDLYNQKYTDWYDGVQDKAAFQKLSDEDKQKVVTNAKAKIKDQVFKKYNFTYNAKKSKPLPKNLY